MITIVLDRQPPPPTEGASSRINAIIDHLRSVDPELRIVVAEAHPRPDRGRLGRLTALMRRMPGFVARTLEGGNRLVLLSAPALPFFDSPSRIDLLLTSRFLKLLRRGCDAKGAAIVLNLHDVRSLQLPDFGVEISPAALEIFRRMERRSFRASHYVLAPGGDWPAYLAGHYGLSGEQLVDFPNGCVRPGAATLPPDSLPGKIRFAYAGTMTPRGRGLERMVEAFRALRNPDASLILMGPGGEWCREAAAGDDRIRYLGALPVDTCIAALRECHVGLYPYPDLFYFNMTATTNKMALYLTCGLPILASRSRAVERFVGERGLGLVCDPGEMTTRMEEMASAPGRLSAWRAASLAAGEDLHWDVIIDRAFATIAKRAGIPPLEATAAEGALPGGAGSGHPERVARGADDRSACGDEGPAGPGGGAAGSAETARGA
jgi:glycosyltransferase involved in cell wall biosynthesis